MAHLNQFEAVLQAAGQSVTNARSQVFTALQGKEPMTMAELVRLTPDIDRASVYRSIALFERLGIVVRLQIGWKYKLELSDVFHEHHHHATCLNCGKSIALPEDAALEQRVQLMAAAKDFYLQSHQLELQGYCSKCQRLQA